MPLIEEHRCALNYEGRSFKLKGTVSIGVLGSLDRSPDGPLGLLQRRNLRNTPHTITSSGIFRHDLRIYFPLFPGLESSRSPRSFPKPEALQGPHAWLLERLHWLPAVAAGATPRSFAIAWGSGFRMV